MAVSPDSRYVATAGGDSSIRIWDAPTGRECTTLLGHKDRVRAVVFDPKSRFLASAGSDGHVNLWDSCRWRGVADEGRLPGGLARVVESPPSGVRNTPVATGPR